MFHKTRHRVRHGLTRLDVRLGIRIALCAVLAMVTARLLGLPSFYWAGISAIIVSTGSPGGSFAASLARFSGTLVGLGVGALLVLLLGHSLGAAALAILVAILLCQLLGLKSSVKVAALSTLFPISLVAERAGLASTWSTVAHRAENVLLGCLVVLLVDGLLWPERSAAKLLERIRTDVASIGRLSAELIRVYLEGKGQPTEALLPKLQAARLTYSELLKEMGSELEDRDAPRETLALQAEQVHLLVDHCAAMQDICSQTSGDRVQALMRPELEALSTCLLVTTQAFDSRGPMTELSSAGMRLEAAYEEIRGDRGTQAYPGPEVFRLLGMLYHCAALVRGLTGLEREQPGLTAEFAE